MLMTASPQSSYMILCYYTAFAQKIWPKNTDFVQFLKKYHLRFIYSIKTLWWLKLCVSLTLSPNPSVYNDIDIYSFEKSQDNVHSLQRIGENSWYQEATLKNCLSCDPSKLLNLAKYSHQLQRAHSQTSSKCISMMMLALPLIYKVNALRYSVFHTPSTSFVTG